MQKVRVELGERSYGIRVGSNLEPGDSLGDTVGTRVLLVTDSNVGPLYAERCASALSARGCDVVVAEVPAGELSKELGQVGALYDRALDAGLDRHAVVVALGGGMVGDLAGFVAATVLRGVRLIQVPTSLLAMVDSSVGGKTGINRPQGKNLVGAFYQPMEVTADLDALSTLPDREYVSGLAEVVKYGIIWDVALFEELEANVSGLRARDIVLLERVVARCCEIKSEVVAIDERESGVRAILNFGHTLGHAIESAVGYGTWLHGEAVAVGMVYAVHLSAQEKGFSGEERDRVVRLLTELGLPVSLHASGKDVSWASLRSAMSSDKKTRAGVPRFVLAERLGGVVFGCEVSDAALEQAYGAMDTMSFPSTINH